MIEQDDLIEVETCEPDLEADRLSKVTGGKSYVSRLQSQLDEEREARIRLEDELLALKKLSHEIEDHIKNNSADQH